MLKDVIPEELYKMGRPAGGEDYNFDLVWQYHSALQVVKVFCERNMVILGGDVYEEKNGILVITSDSWYIKRDKDMSWEEYVQRGCERADEYLHLMYTRNGDKFFYSFTVQINEKREYLL